MRSVSRADQPLGLTQTHTVHGHTQADTDTHSPRTHTDTEATKVCCCRCSVTSMGLQEQLLAARRGPGKRRSPSWVGAQTQHSGSQDGRRLPAHFCPPPSARVSLQQDSGQGSGDHPRPEPGSRRPRRRCSLPRGPSWQGRGSGASLWPACTAACPACGLGLRLGELCARAHLPGKGSPGPPANPAPDEAPAKHPPVGRPPVLSRMAPTPSLPETCLPGVQSLTSWGETSSTASAPRDGGGQGAKWPSPSPGSIPWRLTDPGPASRGRADLRAMGSLRPTPTPGRAPRWLTLLWAQGRHFLEPRRRLSSHHTALAPSPCPPLRAVFLVEGGRELGRRWLTPRLALARPCRRECSFAATVTAQLDIRVPRGCPEFWGETVGPRGGQTVSRAAVAQGAYRFTHDRPFQCNQVESLFFETQCGIRA